MRRANGHFLLVCAPFIIFTCWRLILQNKNTLYRFGIQISIMRPKKTWILCGFLCAYRHVSISLPAAALDWAAELAFHSGPLASQILGTGKAHIHA